MKKLNDIFFSEYKETDNYIKSATVFERGISGYIDKMMETGYTHGKNPEWDLDLKNLKHARWIRNKLAHEEPFDSDICSSDDLYFIVDFRKRIANGTDPLSSKRKKQNRSYPVKRDSRTSRLSNKTGNNTGRAGCLTLVISIAAAILLFAFCSVALS